MAANSTWNPFSTLAWAHSLGLARVPLFGAARRDRRNDDLAVLLDGRRSSFAFYSSDDPKELIQGNDSLSWSWSANLRHILIANKKVGHLIYRRWDAPDTSIKFPIPTTPADAAQIFKKIESMRAGQFGDVISRLLSAFRLVRSNLADYTVDPVIAIQIFNAFLLGTERVRNGELAEHEWIGCRTVGEALSHVPPNNFTGIENLENWVREIPIGGLLSIFVGPDPQTGCWLEPDLLIRHASGIFYQEAHFELEREPQTSLPGMASEPTLKPGSRDARFTPPALARTIVQQSFLAYGANLADSGEELIILDPAMGSGVFLQHALQELSELRIKRPVRLVGIDTSSVSCVISRFCLGRSRLDALAQNLAVTVEITEGDALRRDWPRSHLILTNPPFSAWNKMSAGEREIVVGTLGRLFRGHADKAMSFIWKSVGCLEPGAVLGCIMPSPFLESSAGSKWRAAILENMIVALIGRFRGYNFFQNAMVEPAFIVLKRKVSSRELSSYVKILLAHEGEEDESLRALRRNIETESDPDRYESFSIFNASGNSITAANWIPRSQKAAALIGRLARSGIPTVGDLFKVHQGVRTGSNRAFILSAEDLRALPEREHKFFRPAAGTSTIRDAQIFEEEYVFFPYAEDGTIEIDTVDQLRNQVPEYYDRKLHPMESVLSTRKKVDPTKWWLLTWERQWQADKRPKILTAYFGDRGSFAYDKEGHYVVVQGWGWLWIRDDDSEIESGNDEEDELVVNRPFNESGLPWAYIAVLNSSVFEVLLSHFCPRVQGGQFHLASQFIKNVFLPDLANENSVVADDIRSLEILGRFLSLGRAVDLQEIDRLTANVYGVPLSEWERTK